MPRSIAIVVLCCVLSTPAEAAEILFTPGPIYPLGYASTAQQADLNGDGEPDLVVGGADGTLVLVGNGDGTFTDKGTLAIGHATVGRFTADTTLDLVSFVYPQGPRVYSGNGDGTFAVSGTASGSGPPIGDFDGDGKTDIVIGPSGSAHELRVFGGNGDGTFTERPNVFAPLCAVGDVNGDGRSDLVTGHDFRLGNADGTFTSAPGPRLGSQCFVADLTGDGKPDIVSRSVSSTGQDVLLAVGAGGADYGTPVPIATLPGNAPRSLTVADVDGDSRKDIVIPQSTTVALLRNTPSGSFELSYPITDGVSIAGVAASDYNGDGAVDLALAEQDDEVRIMLQLRDSTPPTTADDVDAAWHPGPVTVTLMATDAGAGVRATYYTKGIDPPAPTTSSAVYDATSRPILENGEVVRYFSVDRYDNAEAVKTSAAAKVDPSVPDTALNAAPPELIANARPTFAFSSAAAQATFECALDGADFSACSSPFQPAAGLTDGSHEFRVRAVSRAGVRDLSPAQTAFTVDTIGPAKPQLTFGPKASTRSRRARFFFVGDGATEGFVCRLDTRAAHLCRSPVAFKRLKRKRHVFRIVAYDAAGNPSEVLTVRWRIRRQRS